MRHGIRNGLGSKLAVALPIALMAMAATAQAQDAPKKGAEAKVCAVTLDPGSIAVQEEHVLLRAKLSTAIGEKLAALVDEASGVQVVGVERAAAAAGVPASPAPPMPATPESPVVNVRLDTSEATAGEWTISFEGEAGKCTGKLAVRPTGPAPR